MLVDHYEHEMKSHMWIVNMLKDCANMEDESTAGDEGWEMEMRFLTDRCSYPMEESLPSFSS